MSASPWSRRVAVLLAMALVAGSVWLAGPRAAGAQEAAPAAVDLEVRVDSRVELLSIVFRLAGNPEYQQQGLAAYAKDIEEQFGAFTGADVVQLARMLRAEVGVSFDAPMSLAFHLDGDLAPRFPLDAEGVTLDARWDPAATATFLQHLQQFREDANFDAFFASHRPLYATAEARLRQLVRRDVDASWVERFFGQKPQSPFVLVPGLGLGGMNFSVTVRAPGGEEHYVVIGVGHADAEGQPVFGKGTAPLVLHEFGHAFVNPLVERQREAWQAAGEALFAVVKERMTRQAYGRWKTMIDETLVRASVIRYLAERKPETAVRVAVRDEEEKGFFWMEDVVQALADYEAHRETYPTLEAFAPRLIDLLNGLAADAASFVQAREARLESLRPHVVDVSIPLDAEGVPPGWRQIVVRFDRPMIPENYSLMTQDRGDRVPEVLAIGFDGSHTVLTIKAQLEPNTRYAFSLNSDYGGSFRSAEGVRLRRVPVRFHTAKASP